MFKIIFYENHFVYEIIWKNAVQPDRTCDNIIWRMRFACWLCRAFKRQC